LVIDLYLKQLAGAKPAGFLIAKYKVSMHYLMSVLNFPSDMQLAI